MPRFFKRRTKDLIADQLPKKIERTIFCPMTPLQIDAYRRILDCPEVQKMVQCVVESSPL